MDKNDAHACPTRANAEEFSETPALNAKPSSEPNARNPKNRANEHDYAEQSAAYQEQLAAMTLQNAYGLAALAAMATVKTPSAVQPVKRLIAAYAVSATRRITQFHQNKKGEPNHE